LIQSRITAYVRTQISKHTLEVHPIQSSPVVDPTDEETPDPEDSDEDEETPDPPDDVDTSDTTDTQLSDRSTMPNFFLIFGMTISELDGHHDYSHGYRDNEEAFLFLEDEDQEIGVHYRY
jgi:hypothetical protein